MSMADQGPTPSEVGQFYDQMMPFFETLWGSNLHVGYWPEEAPELPLEEALERMTDLMVSKAGVGAGKRLLDVGSGVGGPAVKLAQATGCEVVGVTVSPAQAERARQRAAAAELAGRVSFQLADAMKLPFESDSFDAAWAFESLFHMPDRVQVLSEVRRVLRPGGKVIIADIVRGPELEAQEEVFLNNAFKVNAFIAAETYPPLIQQAGLELVELQDVSANTMGTLNRTTEYVFTGPTSETLRGAYGEQGYEAIKGMWHHAANIYAQHLGYVLIVARKPA